MPTVASNTEPSSGSHLDASPVVTIHVQVTPEPRPPHQGDRAAAFLRQLAIVIGAVLAAVAFAAAATRVRSTPIQANIVATEVAMSIVQQEELVAGNSVTEITAGRIRRITTGFLPQLPREVASSTNEELPNLSIRSITAERAITITGLRVAGGSRVNVGYVSPRRYRLELECDLDCSSTPVLRIALTGPVKLHQTGRPERSIKPTDAGMVTLDLDSSSVVEVTLAAGTQSELADQIPVTSMRLERTDRSGGEHESLIERTASSVISGTVQMEALTGSNHILQPGQELRMEFRDAAIRRLTLDSLALNLGFAGTARRLETGSGMGPSNWLPSYLEVWNAHPTLKLFFTFLLTAFGVAYGVARFAMRSE